MNAVPSVGERVWITVSILGEPYGTAKISHLIEKALASGTRLAAKRPSCQASRRKQIEHDLY
jgi:hypothetical protein